MAVLAVVGWTSLPSSPAKVGRQLDASAGKTTLSRSDAWPGRRLEAILMIWLDAVHGGSRTMPGTDKLTAIREALIEGENSGEPQPFDFDQFRAERLAIAQRKARIARRVIVDSAK